MRSRRSDQPSSGTFVVYPAQPGVVGATIEAALATFRDAHGSRAFTSWTETDIAGHFIGTTVLGQIANASRLAADISVLNFNVTYEIEYAIGCKKPLILLRNKAIAPSHPDIHELGIFDTLGHVPYENSHALAAVLLSAQKDKHLLAANFSLKLTAPVYLTDAKFKTDAATRIVSRVKKARLSFRSFDPNEQVRLSGLDAIRQVAESYAVLAHFVPNQIADAQLHNLRSAFIAGLAHGMQKVTLLLQDGNDPVPIDYRDFVVSFKDPRDIDAAIGDFATRATAALQDSAEPLILKHDNPLEKIHLGSSSAENELRDLQAYYIETAAFQRAYRGDVRLVIGRKGSGKSALFHQVRDRIRSQKANIVLDLKPDGYKLLKFKDDVLRLMAKGTKEHTLTAFWEYLLLLEICHKILEKDRLPHTRDPRLFEPYRALSDTYETDMHVSEGDFSERLSGLLTHIANEYKARFGNLAETTLSEARLTELMYVHDVKQLRELVVSYLKNKNALWLLFDNIDKGWPTHGIEDQDVAIIRDLLEATRKLQRQLERDDIDCRTLVFLRNDVYEHLVQHTPDRGKESKVLLDWTDPDLLRELLRRRFVVTGSLKQSVSFVDVWRSLVVSHVNGEESAQHLIDRCLMRPRALIDLINHCRGFAINLGHQKINESDIEKGVEAFSTDLVTEIGLEIRDILPEADNVLYQFIGASERIGAAEIEELLGEISESPYQREAFLELLLWYGFLGLVRPNDEVAYIYTVNYDFGRLRGIERQLRKTSLTYQVNPAFVNGLEIAME